MLGGFILVTIALVFIMYALEPSFAHSMDKSMTVLRNWLNESDGYSGTNTAMTIPLTEENVQKTENVLSVEEFYAHQIPDGDPIHLFYKTSRNDGCLDPLDSNCAVDANGICWCL